MEIQVKGPENYDELFKLEELVWDFMDGKVKEKIALFTSSIGVFRMA